MHYNIEQTLQYAPYICYAVILVVLLLLEVKNRRERLTDQPETERGFLPPPRGDGYEYYINKDTILYIMEAGKNRFKAYAVQGDLPKGHIKKDKYGKYVNIHANSATVTETILERAYRKQ